MMHRSRGDIRRFTILLSFLICFLFLFGSCGAEEQKIPENSHGTESPAEDPPQTKEPIVTEYQKYLNEKYKDDKEMEYGLDITKKTNLVAICYSMWFNAILGDGNKEPSDVYNITEILAGNGDWGPENAFHYWARPQLGYYRSTDKNVIRTHMTQLAEAGVDFIILDYTYCRDGWYGSAAWTSYVQKPCKALLDTIVKMREEGLRTPYVVFWGGAPTLESDLFENFYRYFYSKEQWKDCFVYWEGKPFALTWTKEDQSIDTFTIRGMNGLRTDLDPGQWSFLNITNVPSYGADGFVEQVGVCVAAQETYMSEPTAHGRNHGIFFYEQWQTAFKYRPKIVTLTWWNEWAAQRDAQNRFVDNYNMEYSRDIEPMDGGHGDQYYRWMCEYIRAYRAGEECPRLVEAGY